MVQVGMSMNIYFTEQGTLPFIFPAFQQAQPSYTFHGELKQKPLHGVAG